MVGRRSNGRTVRPRRSDSHVRIRKRHRVREIRECRPPARAVSRRFSHPCTVVIESGDDVERGAHSAGGGEIGASEVTPRKVVRRRRFIIVAVVAVAFLGVAIIQGVSNTSTSGSKVLVEQTHHPAYAFRLHELTSPSRSLSLTSFRGKALVINFWASWCVPCRTEMPLLERAFTRLKGTVQFLGVDSNDSRRAGLAFYRHVHVSYPAVSDPSAVLAVRYGLVGFPTTIFVSPAGINLGRYIGQLSEKTLRASLGEAFGVSISQSSP